jgi:hypothetical protein
VSTSTFNGDLSKVDPTTVPGSAYNTNSACILSCDLTLAPSMLWVFGCDDGLTIGAGVTLSITNGIADAGNTVVWTVGAYPVVAGAESNVIGDLASLGAITLGALSTWVGVLNAGGAVNIGAGSTVTGNVDAVGAITLGASAEVEGTLASSAGAVDLGANAIVEGAVNAEGAITLAASAKAGDAGTFKLTSGAAVTLGAGARSGEIDASGAITLGALAEADGVLTSDAAITLGAGAKSQVPRVAPVITLGAGYGNLASDGPPGPPSRPPGRWWRSSQQSPAVKGVVDVAMKPETAKVKTNGGSSAAPRTFPITHALLMAIVVLGTLTL